MDCRIFVGGNGSILERARKDILVGCALLLLCCCGLIQCELKAVPVSGKAASQSSLYGTDWIHFADRAVDGNLSTFSQTDYNDSHPWWQVDLGTEHFLCNITVTLRQDCCDEYRFTGTVVRAGNSSNYTDNQPCDLPATRAQSSTGAVFEVSFDEPRMARYVSLDIDPSIPNVTLPMLQIAEVEIYENTWGPCFSPKAVNLSGQPTSQSSLYNMKNIHFAKRAIDGDSNTFQLTDVHDPHPWWKVDLGTEHCVTKINVTLRQDCCDEHRFTGTFVRAGNNSNCIENQPCGLPATRANSSTGAVFEAYCDEPRMARYVSLDIDPSITNVTLPMLQIAEVEIYELISRECSLNKAVLKFKNFKMLHKYSVIADSEPLATKMPRSLLHCATFCISHPECVSFDYAPGNECLLHNINATNIDITPHDNYTVYILAE